MSFHELIGSMSTLSAAPGRTFLRIASTVSSASADAAGVSAADVSATDVSPTDVGRSILGFLGRLHIPTGVALILSLLLFIGILTALELLRSKYVLNVTRRTLIMKDLPRGFDGTKLCIISDLHQMRFGENNEELAKKIKREEPDYILFPGDMGDCDSFNVDAFYDLLESLGDDIPVILSPGNDDLKLGGGRVHRNFLKEVENAGAVMLNNSCAVMTYEGEKIYIYGFTQPLEPKKKVPVKLWENAPIAENDVLALLGKCPKDAPVILLAHDPRPFGAYRKWGASLVVSGHMQGGMIRLPVIGGLIGPSGELRPRYSGGLYERNGSAMYVTRGLGSSGKLRRFLNAPEIAVLTLACRPEKRQSKAARAAIRRKNSSARSIFGDVKQQLSGTGEYFRSEAHSLRDLLDERLTQLRDFFALLFGKKRSRFAIKVDEEKRRNTYVAPKKKPTGTRYASHGSGKPGNRPNGSRPNSGSRPGGSRPNGGRPNSGTARPDGE